MSKTTIDSSTRPAPTPTINPVLQAALSGIDVQLEEELARYRRQKSGRPATATRTLGRHQTRKSLELISVGTQGNTERSPVVEMSETTPTSYGQLGLVNPTAVPRLTDRTVSRDDPSLVESGEPLSFSITVAKNATPPIDDPASVNSSPLDTSQQEAAVGVNLANPSATNRSPDDYLASSEQLLRSLAEEDAPGKTERSFLDKVLTPLGVGLLLLLLLSSATVGYMVMNPSSLTYLGLDRFWKPKTPTVAQSPIEATPTANNQPKGAQILNGPNLASEEFADLNLNTLSSVRAVPNDGVSQLPTQSALPRVAAGAVTPAQLRPGQASSDLASAILPSTVSSASVSPRIPNVAPLPAPSATPVARGIQAPGVMSTPSASQRSERGKDFYYVLTNYESDRSLSVARKIVSDAYIRNFPDGARIQLGTFPKEPQAQALVQQIQKQGISAWVYHP